MRGGAQDLLGSSVDSVGGFTGVVRGQNTRSVSGRYSPFTPHPPAGVLVCNIARLGAGCYRGCFCHDTFVFVPSLCMLGVDRKDRVSAERVFRCTETPAASSSTHQYVQEPQKTH